MKDEQEVESWTCESCKKIFREQESKILECERCESHYCAKCVRISDSEYEFMTARKDIHWFCEECDKKVTQGLRIEKDIELMILAVEQKLQVFTTSMEIKFRDLEEKWEKKMSENVSKFIENSDSRITKLERELKTLNGRVVKAGDEVNTLKKEIDQQFMSNDKDIENVASRVHTVEQKIEEKVDDTAWANVAAKHVNESLGVVAEEVRDIGKRIEETKKARIEEEDKEARRNNIILYRVPESEAETAAERSEEDKKFCEKLMTGLEIGAVPEDIKKVIRLGRRDQDRPRPILVELTNRHIKNLVMESLFKLRSMQAKFQGIGVAHDMTKKEREECKELVLEAKAKSTGEWIYLVRGAPGQMKIIQVRRR